MALSVAQLTELRDALETARLRGAKSVEYDSQRVEYKTDAEMRRAIVDTERRIAAAQNQKPVTDIRFNCSKGL